MAGFIDIETSLWTRRPHFTDREQTNVAIYQRITQGPANLIDRHVTLRTHVSGLRMILAPLTEMLERMIAESLTSGGVRDITVREAQTLLEKYRPASPE